MFRNLKRAYIDEGYSTKLMAEYLGVSEKSVTNKIKGDTEFTFAEYQKIKRLLHKYSAEWLFADDEDQPA